ncbi:MAG: HlyC/CorC family transporter, partial [Rickettsiales bacterium]|nr:HlyC/CorC family transporter [Rickettsiales bacterium]
LIGAILLGNNAVNIGASALATSFAIHYFGEQGVIYATVAMTLLVLIFAEVLPKTYAFRNAEKVALSVAPMLQVVVKMLAPITGTVQWIVEQVLQRISPSGSGEAMISSAEVLRGAIELHHREGGVRKQHRDMLGSILDLGETEVGEVMVHRRHMETLNLEDPPERLLKKVLGGSHTRFPVWKGRPENIVGVLHAKNLLRAVQQHKGVLRTLNVEKILTPAWFIPHTTTLQNQLQAFRRRRHHFALVVDEYGSLMGLVTLEDILEEIVGQIEDEYDLETSHLKKQKDGSYVVDGTMTVRDLNRALDWNLPDDLATTVAGLVIHEAQRIPEEGQVFRFHGVRFTIMQRQRHQLVKLKLQREAVPNEEYEI